MQIWIDVEDASGNRYGDGPIVTATEWTSTRRLNAAGGFTFTMPASDPRSNFLAHKRIVRCWAAPVFDEIREIGSGIIDTIEVVTDARGATALRVSGDDLLRELANRTVGDLEIKTVTTENIGFPMQISYSDGTPNTTLSLPATVDLSPAEPISFLNIRHIAPFNKITFAFSDFNTAASTSLVIQYLARTQNNTLDWVTVPGLVNGTISSGKPFAQNGDVTFDVPSGWVAGGSGEYTVRFFDQTVDLEQFVISAISVTVTTASATALADIMALAPAGWSLDPVAGHLATATSVYLAFAGESVLAALVRLSEQTGENFALGFSGRRIRWLQKDMDFCGIRLLQRVNTEPYAALYNDYAMYIASLSRTADSYELVTRLYPYGGGTVGDARVTLANTTRSQPTGYTLDKTNNYLENNAATAEYGRIDRRFEAPDIVPVDVSASGSVTAANMLFDRTYEELLRKSQLQYAYAVEVTPTSSEVWPGQYTHVTYHEWVDGYHAVNIDDDLWILETTTRVSPSDGLHTIGLTVATVDYWPITDHLKLAEELNKNEIVRGVDPPASGYTSSRTGTVTFLAVENGLVTDVRRANAVADGLYPPEPATDTLKWFRTVGGVITEIGWDT